MSCGAQKRGQLMLRNTLLVREMAMMVVVMIAMKEYNWNKDGYEGLQCIPPLDFQRIIGLLTS